eukprot:scaffold957_cov402-Prasinococcus_capsulatus_cf.AAC.2
MFGAPRGPKTPRLGPERRPPSRCVAEAGQGRAAQRSAGPTDMPSWHARVTQRAGAGPRRAATADSGGSDRRQRRQQKRQQKRQQQRQRRQLLLTLVPPSSAAPRAPGSRLAHRSGCSALRREGPCRVRNIVQERRPDSCTRSSAPKMPSTTRRAAHSLCARRFHGSGPTGYARLGASQQLWDGRPPR